MQRWLFFIFCIIGNILLAQPLDVQSVQLSIWKEGRFASGNPSELEASAEISFKASQLSSKAILLAKGLRVKKVELREGRIKGKLKWRQENDSLFIEIPPGKRDVSVVKIDYQVNLDDEVSELFLQKTENIFALNAMNASSDFGMGIPGMWFPAISGDKFRMELAITTTAKENIGFSGEEQYKVKLPNDLVAHFWSSKGEIMAQDFYLVIGRFDEFDAKDLEEEFELSEVALKLSKHEEAKRKIAPFLALYGLSVSSFADSEYTAIDSLSTLDFSAFFLQKPDLPEVDENQYQREVAVAYYIEGLNMQRGSERHFLAYSEKMGGAWLDALMEQKWQNRKHLQPLHYERVLKYMQGMAKRKISPFMALYQLAPASIPDSGYAKVDSLKNTDFGSFFLKNNDIPEVSAEQYSYEAALAYYLENENMLAASERHWTAYVAKNGEKWKAELMQRKWEQRAELDSASYHKALMFLISQYQSNNPDLISAISPRQLDSALIKPLMNRAPLPVVHFEYRYVSGDKALYVKYTQDTSSSQVYSFPVRVIVRSGDLIDTTLRVVDQVNGDLKVPFPKVPNLAKVEVGDFFPGVMTDKRPDTYNLFQLGKAESEEEREEALIGLFKTSNPNLFSTALGIAMDDKQARLRSRALDYAEDLNPAGQKKLKDTIIALSENDPNAEVREKAKILVTKYYEPK